MGRPGGSLGHSRRKLLRSDYTDRIRLKRPSTSKPATNPLWFKVGLAPGPDRDLVVKLHLQIRLRIAGSRYIFGTNRARPQGLL